MKYLKVFLAFVVINIFSSYTCFAQGWQWQNPLPTGNRIYCMDFVDSLTGWFGNSAGTSYILRMAVLVGRFSILD